LTTRSLYPREDVRRYPSDTNQADGLYAVGKPTTLATWYGTPIRKTPSLIFNIELFSVLLMQIRSLK
jgi:hypothetical protein